MNHRRHRFSPADSFSGETLESRVVLSAVALDRTVEVAARSVHRVATTTTLAVTSGTLGQPTTFNVTVRGPAAARSPRGTVNLVVQGKVIQTLTLSPTTPTRGRFAYSSASYTLAPQPGGPANYFGKYSMTAQFVPSGPFKKSTATQSFGVTQPTYQTLPDGVKLAIISPGSGPAIQSGQQAEVLYTGYLDPSGTIFDASSLHGNAPLSFTVGAGKVIPGFDEGTAGMQVGETRIVEIPPAQGYGSVANGPIPANSTLIFLVTLQSIG